MTKIVLLNKVRGEDKNNLMNKVELIVNCLRDNGFEVYCSFLDKKMEGKSKKELIKNSFQHIDFADDVLFYVKSDEKSEGMLIEFGYCVAKDKNIILLIGKKVYSPYMREVASKVIEFKDFSEIKTKLLGISK